MRAVYLVKGASGSGRQERSLLELFISLPLTSSNRPFFFFDVFAFVVDVFVFVFVFFCGLCQRGG